MDFAGDKWCWENEQPLACNSVSKHCSINLNSGSKNPHEACLSQQFVSHP